MREEIENRIAELQEEIRTVRGNGIFALQREYNAALEEYHRWAKANPSPVPRGENAQSSLVIYHFETIGPFHIRII